MDEYMEDSVAAFKEAIVGHSIVSFDKLTDRSGFATGVFTLDNGKRVTLRGTSECCAYADLEGILQRLPTVGHVITDVTTEEDYTVWHIIAGLWQVLDLDVSWSEGTGYYMYGFDVEVED